MAPENRRAKPAAVTRASRERARARQTSATAARPPEPEPEVRAGDVTAVGLLRLARVFQLRAGRNEGRPRTAESEWESEGPPLADDDRRTAGARIGDRERERLEHEHDDHDARRRESPGVRPSREIEGPESVRVLDDDRVEPRARSREIRRTVDGDGQLHELATQGGRLRASRARWAGWTARETPTRRRGRAASAAATPRASAGRFGSMPGRTRGSPASTAAPVFQSSSSARSAR